MSDPFGDKTLLIDGDILVYRPCCIFMEDDSERAKEIIVRNIKSKLSDLCSAAGASKYRMFMTTKTNFRNHLVDDYKANRANTPRPTNLAFAKKYAVENLGAEYVPYLEADDLLGIYMTDETVLWSLDKDLRQIAGQHLDDDTSEIVTITELGYVERSVIKYKFTGYKGFMFQLLTGDGADYIIGCGVRETKVYKSGAKAGQQYQARSGIGPAKAMGLLDGCSCATEMLQVVKDCYKKVHGEDYIHHLEVQGNLLYMAREYDEDSNTIKRWTHDGRDEYMNLLTGEIFAN